MMPLFRQERCTPGAPIRCHADFTSRERQHRLAQHDSFSIFIFHYWYCKVHYQYCHGPLLVMAFNSARTGIGISALLLSTSMGTSHYWQRHANMPVAVVVLFHIGLVPVWA